MSWLIRILFVVLIGIISLETYAIKKSVTVIDNININHYNLVLEAYLDGCAELGHGLCQASYDHSEQKDSDNQDFMMCLQQVRITCESAQKDYKENLDKINRDVEKHIK
jgi:hypothetical protein